MPTQLSFENGQLLSWPDEFPKIASTFGRLVFIASLDGEKADAGRQMLIQRNGAAPAACNLDVIHNQYFAAWLHYKLYQQVSDVRLYLTTIPEEARRLDLHIDSYVQLAPESAQHGDRKLWECNLDVVLAMIRSRWERNGSASNFDLQADRHDWRVERALHSIELEFHSHSLDETVVCRNMRTSTRYLSRLFKREIGSTFREYLRFFRMRKAVELLSDASLTVQQVAKEVGYVDPSNFGRDFRALLGVTPRQYRLARLL